MIILTTPQQPVNRGEDQTQRGGRGGGGGGEGGGGGGGTRRKGKERVVSSVIFFLSCPTKLRFIQYSKFTSKYNLCNIEIAFSSYSSI